MASFTRYYSPYTKQGRVWFQAPDSKRMQRQYSQVDVSTQLLSNVGWTSRPFLPKTDRHLFTDKLVDEWISKEGLDVSKFNEYRRTDPDFPALWKDFVKYDKPEPAYDDAAFEKAFGFLVQHFYSHCAESPVLGHEVIDTWEGRSSPGFPWNLEFKDSTSFLKKYETMLPKWFDSFLDGGSLHTLWQVSPKSEIRSWDKIKQRKIRSFTASPKHFSYVCQRLCLGFNQKFYNSAGKTWSRVGFTPFHGGWHDLILCLSRLLNGYSFDATQWDASMSIRLLRAICKFRKMCMRDAIAKDSRIGDALDRLYDDIISGFCVLPGGGIFQKTKGNPSGSPNTVVDNTLGLFLVFAYCVICMHWEDGKDVSYDQFMELFQAAFYGDDNTVTIDPSVPFCVDSLLEHSTAIGVSLRSELEEIAPAEKLEFLSMTSVKFRGMYVPVPKSLKILGSLRWKKATPLISYVRVSGLRLIAYFSEVRPLLDSYAAFLRGRLGSLLQSDSCDNEFGVTGKAAGRAYLTDLEIENIYLGLEGLDPQKRIPFNWCSCGMPIDGQGVRARCGMCGQHIMSSQWGSHFRIGCNDFKLVPKAPKARARKSKVFDATKGYEGEGHAWRDSLKNYLSPPSLDLRKRFRDKFYNDSPFRAAKRGLDDRVVGAVFDSTKGYPGEGPPKSKPAAKKGGQKMGQRFPSKKTSKKRVGFVRSRKGRPRSANIRVPMMIVPKGVKMQQKTLQSGNITKEIDEVYIGTVTLTQASGNYSLTKWGPLLPFLPVLEISPFNAGVQSFTPGLATRAQQQARMHEMWRLKKWVLKIAPKVGMTATGDYLVWSDPDVSDDNSYQYGNEAIEQLGSSHAAKEARFAEGTRSFEFPATGKWFYPFQTSSNDLRSVSPGNMYVALTTDPKTLYTSVSQANGAVVSSGSYPDGTVEVAKVYLSAIFEFKKPKLTEAFDFVILQSSNATGSYSTGTTYSNSTPWVKLSGLNPTSNVFKPFSVPATSLVTQNVTVNSEVPSGLQTGNVTNYIALNNGIATPENKFYLITVQTLAVYNSTAGGTIAHGIGYYVNGAQQTFATDVLGSSNMTWSLDVPSTSVGPVSSTGNVITTTQVVVQIPQGISAALPGNISTGCVFALTFNVSASNSATSVQHWVQISPWTMQYSDWVDNPSGGTFALSHRLRLRHVASLGPAVDMSLSAQSGSAVLDDQKIDDDGNEAPLPFLSRSETDSPVILPLASKANSFHVSHSKKAGRKFDLP